MNIQNERLSAFCRFAAEAASSLETDTERVKLSILVSNDLGPDGHAWFVLQDTSGWSASMGWGGAGRGRSRQRHSYFFPDLGESAFGRSRDALTSEVDAPGIVRLINYLSGTRNRTYHRLGFNCSAFAAGAFEAATGTRAPGRGSLLPVWTPSMIQRAIIKANTHAGTRPTADHQWPQSVYDGESGRRSGPTVTPGTHVLDATAVRIAQEYLANQSAIEPGELIHDVYRRASVGMLLLPKTLGEQATLGQPLDWGYDVAPGDYLIYNDPITGQLAGGICTTSTTLVGVDPSGIVAERKLPSRSVGGFCGKLSQFASPIVVSAPATFLDGCF